MSNDNPFNVNKELLDYVKSAKEHGLPDSEIKQNLLNAGWEPEDIENTFAHFVASIHMQKAAIETQSSLLSPLMHEKTEPGTPLTSTTQNFVQQPAMTTVKKSHWGRWLFLFILLLLLAGGAFYVYTYGYFTPTQIWNKFSKTEESKIYKNKFSFSYNDNYTPPEEQVGKKVEFKNIKGSFDGSFYINVADAKNPESSSEVQYTLGSGNTNVSTGFQYRLKNNSLYINAGSNPFLDLFTQSLSDKSGKKPEWLKLDLNALQNSSAQKPQAGSEDLDKFKAVFNDEFKNKLEKIWTDAKLVKIKSVLGHEKLNGIMTLHFENELDKTALSNLMNSYIDSIAPAIAKASGKKEIKQEDLDLGHELAKGIVDKISISNFETWIGVKDFRLYKVKLTSNAPSILGLIYNSENTQTKTEGNFDNKRTQDITQLGLALDNYFDDNKGYPEGKDGQPIGLSPNYIAAIPEAPKPANGQCSDYYNTYWYTPKGDKKLINGKTIYSDYEYGFCLGGPVTNFKSGLAKLTPKGVESGLACSDTAEHCKPVSSEETLAEKQKALNEFLSKLDFNAQINLQAEYSDFGQIRAIDEPKEFYDLTQMIMSSAVKDRDYERLTDIRFLSTKLQVYYDDNNKYPASLTDLMPTYLTEPVGDTLPADGTCTSEQNQYKYSSLGNGTSYQITFCLGDQQEGYSPGVHTLTPAGIK